LHHPWRNGDFLRGLGFKTGSGDPENEVIRQFSPNQEKIRVWRAVSVWEGTRRFLPTRLNFTAQVPAKPADTEQ